MAKKSDKEMYEAYLYFLAYQQAIRDISHALFKAVAEVRREELEKRIGEKTKTETDA